MKQALMTGLLIIVCGGLLLGGCAGKQAAPPEKSVARGYEFADSTGHTVKLAQKPRRIVSLSIGTDEILTALVSADRIAALTYLADDDGISNISGQAKQVPARVKASAETVVALQPDLVIVPDWQPLELVQLLRDAGVTVYVYKDPATIAEVRQIILEIARVVGEEPAAERIVAGMDAELAGIAEKVNRVPAAKRQLVVQFTLMGGGGGYGSTFDDLCRHAGVINGAAGVGLGRGELLSKEQIVAINPDIFLLPTWDATGRQDPERFKAEVQSDPAFQTVKAIRRQKLFPVPDRHIHCTSQYIVYGVRDIANAAYPEYMGAQ